MTPQGKRKPIRLGWTARRAFYKTVHAMLPRKIREPIRNAIKGPPPTAEQLAAQRQAEAKRRQAEAEERQARNVAHGRAKTTNVAEKERATWVKEEAAALKRETAKEERAKRSAERQAEKEAEERERVTHMAEKERKSWAKAETGAAKPDKS